METKTEENKKAMKAQRLRAILAWYHIMLDNIVEEKYQDALEDSTQITLMINKMIEEQEAE